MKNKRMNNKGFSLVELIVVIAIMAILAVTLAPKLTQYINKARNAGDQEAVTAIYTAAKLANSEFPLGASVAATTIPLEGATAEVINASTGAVTTAADGLYTQSTTDPQLFSLNEHYTVTSYADFLEAMIATLSDFRLKNTATAAATLQLSTNADGEITVVLSFDSTIGDADDITVTED